LLVLAATAAPSGGFGQGGRITSKASSDGWGMEGAWLLVARCSFVTAFLQLAGDSGSTTEHWTWT
jgi:hypothetical protein